MKNRIKIEAKRWPWQPGYNWHGMISSSAPFNQPLPGEKAAPRFGGGWKYQLGFSMSSSKNGATIVFDLLFGMVKITYRSKAGIEFDRQSEERRAAAFANIESRRNARIEGIPF